MRALRQTLPTAFTLLVIAAAGARVTGIDREGTAGRFASRRLVLQYTGEPAPSVWPIWIVPYRRAEQCLGARVILRPTRRYQCAPPLDQFVHFGASVVV